MSKTSVRDTNPQLLKFQSTRITLADVDNSPAASGIWVKDVLQIPIMRFPPIPESYTWAIEILKVHYDLEMDMPTLPSQIQYGFNLDIIDPNPTTVTGTTYNTTLTSPTDQRVLCTNRRYVAPGIYYNNSSADVRPAFNWNVDQCGTIDLTDGRGNGILFVGSNLFMETAIEAQPLLSNAQWNYSVSVDVALNIEYRLKHVGLDEVVQELTGLLSL